MWRFRWKLWSLLEDDDHFDDFNDDHESWVISFLEFESFCPDDDDDDDDFYDDVDDNDFDDELHLGPEHQAKDNRGADRDAHTEAWQLDLLITVVWVTMMVTYQTW